MFSKCILFHRLYYIIQKYTEIHDMDNSSQNNYSYSIHIKDENIPNDEAYTLEHMLHSIGQYSHNYTSETNTVSTLPELNTSGASGAAEKETIKYDKTNEPTSSNSDDIELAFYSTNQSDYHDQLNFPTNKIQDIRELDDLCIRSYTPLMLSTHGSRIQSRNHSRNNSNHNSDNEEEKHNPTPMLLDKINHLYHTPVKYKKLTYKEVAKSLEHYYDDYDKYSNEMDILIVYVRGQKNLFSHSSYVTYFKLYSMLVLALTITAFVTVITPFIAEKSWNTILITSCNATATLIISLTRYFDLEFTGNAYSFLANNYEKFERSLEMANNKLTLIKNEEEQNNLVMDKIKELEFKVGEIRDIFQVVLPNEVKMLFPVISHINIFSLIKKTEAQRALLTTKFKDIKNEINYNIYKINKQYHTNYSDFEDVEDMENLQYKEKKRILFLNEIKDKIKNELINYKNTYNELEYLFTKEIQFAEKHLGIVYILPLYFWIMGKPKYLNIQKYKNPTIIDFLNIILSDD